MRRSPGIRNYVITMRIVRSEFDAWRVVVAGCWVRDDEDLVPIGPVGEVGLHTFGSGP